MKKSVCWLCFLACCMAAGMASAVFAEEEPPLPAAAAAEAPPDPAPTEAPAPEPTPEPTRNQSRNRPRNQRRNQRQSQPRSRPKPPRRQRPRHRSRPPRQARHRPRPRPLHRSGRPHPRPPAPRCCAPLPEMTAQPAAVTGVVLIDSIAADGCLTAQVNGSDEKLPGAVYTWYRSRDGADWQTVTPQICSGSGWNIEAGSEQRLNAALDSCVAGIGDADRLYYKVEVTGADGTALAAQTRVAYYIQLQNGSFEAPAVAGSSTLYYPFEAKRSHFYPDGGRRHQPCHCMANDRRSPPLEQPCQRPLHRACGRHRQQLHRSDRRGAAHRPQRPVRLLPHPRRL